MSKLPNIRELVRDEVQRVTRGTPSSAVPNTARSLGGSTSTAAPSVITSTDTLREGTTNLYFTDARVYAAVKALLLSGGDNVIIASDDEEMTLTITVSGSGLRWGAGAPDNALGSNGESYLNTTNGDIYGKAAGAWTLTFSPDTHNDARYILLPATPSRGDLLMRGAAAWGRLEPGVAGRAVISNGSGADLGWGEFVTPAQLTVVKDNLALNYFMDEVRAVATATNIENGFVDAYQDETRVAVKNGVVYSSGKYYTNSSGPYTLTSGLVSYWRLDETSGTARADAQGANNATAYNTPTIIDSMTGYGKANQFVRISSQYLTAGTTGFPTGSSDRTVTTWLYLSTSTAANEYYLFMYGSLSANALFNLEVYNDKLYHSQYGDSLTGGTKLSNSAWYFAAIVLSSGQGRLWLNNNWDSAAKAMTYNTSAGSTMQFARASNGLAYHNGYLDDVRVYNRALSNTELAAIYAGEPGNITEFSSTAVTAGSAPGMARLLIFEEDIDAVTLNTDLLAYVSRDNGTTWTQVTLAEKTVYVTGRRVLAGEVDISGQPSGTSMKYKLTSANLKGMNLRGAALMWW